MFFRRKPKPVVLNIDKEKIINLTETILNVPSKDYEDYLFHGTNLTKDAWELETYVRGSEKLRRLSSYLVDVALAAEDMGGTLRNIYDKVYSKNPVIDKDTENHYQALVNLAGLYETGISLNKKYKRKMDEDIRKKLSGILGIMKNELNHANKIFRYDIEEPVVA